MRREAGSDPGLFCFLRRNTICIIVTYCIKLKNGA